MHHSKSIEHIFADFFNNSSYKMINVTNKATTKRKALAYGKIRISKEVFDHVKNKTLVKGDVLPLAEIAGINGAKNTANVLPLCHPLPIDQIAIKHELNHEETTIETYCYVEATTKTGVEMEAIAGVQTSLLCIYDLCKMYTHQMVISEIKLLYKDGGKSKIVLYPDNFPKSLLPLIDCSEFNFKDIKFAAITISDRASKGDYEDRSGAILIKELENLGAKDVIYQCVSDDKTAIKSMVHQLSVKTELDVIFTTGGTGISPRDNTHDVIAELVDCEIAGLAELLRSHGAQYTKYSWLSRSIVGLVHKKLIITLPGSTKAISQGIEALKDIIPHSIRMINGEGHD